MKPRLRPFRDVLPKLDDVPLSRTTETPELIVTGIRAGDRNAEVLLYEKYYRTALYILERKVGDAEQARDLCQEAFCILLERLRSQGLDEPQKLAAYLHSIATNLHIAEVRKAGRRKTHANQGLVDLVSDGKQNQYNKLVRERSAQAVRRLIDAMTNERDRRLLYGFYIQEKDKDDICRELELSERHFDKVLYRAKQRFRDLVLNGGDSRSDEGRR